MNTRLGNVVVCGASRGIGLATAAHVLERAEQVWSVSRSPSPHGMWIEADLSTREGVRRVVEAVGSQRIDALLYVGGTWEQGAFTDEYSFIKGNPEDVDRVLAVNLVAPIKLVHGLLPALRRAAKPRVVLIGSLSGLDNRATREVANSASKYGLRGAAHALSLEVPDVAVTVINPGNVATPEVQADIAEGRFGAQTPIPMPDLLATIDYALALSSSSVATEINLAQTRSSANR